MKRLLLIGLFLWGQQTQGQSDTTQMVPLDSLPPRTDFPYGFVSELGYAQTIYSISNLKSFLKANRISEPVTSTFQVHLGFGFRYKRLKIVAQTNIPLPERGRKAAPGTWVVRQRGGYQYGLVAGFDLLNGYSRRLYLYSGLGITAVNLDVYQKSGQTAPFNSIIQNSVISGPSLLRIAQAPYVDMGLEYSHREKRSRSVSYTVRLGYRLGVKHKPWENEVYSFSDPLADKVSQFNVSYIYAWSDNFSRSNRKKP